MTPPADATLCSGVAKAVSAARNIPNRPPLSALPVSPALCSMTLAVRSSSAMGSTISASGSVLAAAFRTRETGTPLVQTL